MGVRAGSGGVGEVCGWCVGVGKGGIGLAYFFSHWEQFGDVIKTRVGVHTHVHTFRMMV